MIPYSVMCAKCKVVKLFVVLWGHVISCRNLFGMSGTQVAPYLPPEERLCTLIYAT